MTNSIAERDNQTILNITTACLLEAGLPPCVWPTAIECASHLMNIEHDDDDDDHDDDDESAWSKLHGKEFSGQTITLGAKVFFQPNPVRTHDQKHKFDPNAK